MFVNWSLEKTLEILEQCMILGWKRSAATWRCFQSSDPGLSLHIPCVTHTLIPHARHTLRRHMTHHPDLKRQKQVRNVLNKVLKKNCIQVIDQAWGHLDGWILTKIFFVCVYGLSCSPCTWICKQRLRPISSHLDCTSLVKKDLLYGIWEPILLWDTVGNPKQARRPHHAHLSGQSQHRIWFSLPTSGASHLIISNYICYKSCNG